MRKYISVFLAVLLIASALFIARTIAGGEKMKRPAAEKVVQSVFVDTVRNHSVPVKITESGRLVAKKRIELYAEVQGIMEVNGKEFKPGAVYN